MTWTREALEAEIGPNYRLVAFGDGDVRAQRVIDGRNLAAAPSPQALIEQIRVVEAIRGSVHPFGEPVTGGQRGERTPSSATIRS